MRKLTTIIAVCLLVLSFKTTITNKQYLNQGLKSLQIKNVYVHIIPLKKKLKDQVRFGIDLKGHLSGTNGQYILQLDTSLPEWERRNVIAHELIHLQQLESKELLVRGKQVIYKRLYYRNITVIPYSRRPWEVDADKEGKILARKLNIHFKSK